jgi:hypothetical protein
MASMDGPFLIDAMLCEKILEEKDGVKSAIRMVDRITRTVLGPDPPSQMEPFDYEITLLIRFKSGRTRGTYPLKIVFVQPSGESRTQAISINFEGEDDRGVDIVAPLRINLPLTGVYWIEVYLQDEFLTKVPMRVIYMPQTIRMQKTPEPGEE